MSVHFYCRISKYEVCQQGHEELNEGHNIILEEIKEDYQGKQGITENEPEVRLRAVRYRNTRKRGRHRKGMNYYVIILKSMVFLSP